MKKAVNKNFWNEKRGSYDYLAGECDYAEGLGLAFAVLFGIADERQTALIGENTHLRTAFYCCMADLLALASAGMRIPARSGRISRASGRAQCTGQDIRKASKKSCI